MAKNDGSAEPKNVFESIRGTSIGKVIRDYRLRHGLSQENMGDLFGITGPAIYKFERGESKPTFRLWKEISEKLQLPTKKMVLLWTKAQVPNRYRDIFMMKKAPHASSQRHDGEEFSKNDYSAMKYVKSIQKMAERDDQLPDGLKEFIADDAMWAIYNPTGQEINMLRDIFGELGKGNKELYREALVTFRMFK